MPSRYDDDLWESVPEHHHHERPGDHRICRDPGRSRSWRVDWVRSLDRARAALDLGCGDGRASPAIPADSLTIADVSSVALARARTRVPEAEAVEVEPDAPLPFDDGSFDLVVCTETLEHVRDVQLLLSEVRRVLEPGGRLAVTTPAHPPLMRVPDPLSPHIRFFTRRSLRALLDAMGFDVRTLERRGGGLFALASR